MRFTTGVGGGIVSDAGGRSGGRVNEGAGAADPIEPVRSGWGAAWDDPTEPDNEHDGMGK